MAHVGNIGSNKIIVTDALGKTSPGTLGSGMALSAGTVTAGTTIAFDCDFRLLSNQAITGSVVLTDQASRTLTFTSSFVGTASAAIVDGSGLEFTTASNISRSRIFTSFGGFNRNVFFGPGYRIWMRWANYTPLGSTQGLYTGMSIESTPGGGAEMVPNLRQNNANIYNNFGPLTYQINFPTADASYNVLVLERVGGVFTTFYGYSATGLPAYNDLRVLSNGDMRNLSTAFWQNRDISTHGVEMTFVNAIDSTSRSMYCTNMRVELLR